MIILFRFRYRLCAVTRFLCTSRLSAVKNIAALLGQRIALVLLVVFFSPLPRTPKKCEHFSGNPGCSLHRHLGAGGHGASASFLGTFSAGEGCHGRSFAFKDGIFAKPNHPSRLSWAREHLCDRRIYVGDESNDIVCSRPDSSPRTAVPFLMIYTLTRDDMPSLRTQIKKFSFRRTRIFWWRQQNSNLRPLACQASTLTN